LQYKVQVQDEIDMLNYYACEGSVQGKLSSRGHKADNNMTDGGETRSTYTAKELVIDTYILGTGLFTQ
jgi:hypothetical protein